MAPGITIGALTAQNRRASSPATNGAGAVRAVSKLAVMAIMLPLIGIRFTPALVALIILAIPTDR